MKRCPQCDSLFPDEENFCEIDGTVLVAEEQPDVSRNGLVVPQPATDRSLLVILAIGAVILGVLLVFGYLVLTRPREPLDQSARSSNVAPQQVPSTPLLTVHVATPTPSVEPSPSPSVSPTPSPQPTTTPFQLSSSPISTNAASKGKSGLVKITLDSGVVIEAEEVWQTGEGIWYRKAGVISLIDPKHIKAIERPAQPVASPSASPTQ